MAIARTASQRRGVVVAIIGVILLLTGCSTAPSDRSAVDPAAREAAVEKAQGGAAELLDAGMHDNQWTGPENSPPPRPGLRITLIPEQMASTGSSRPAKAIESEVEKLGWVPKISDGQGKPEVQLNALNTAVDEKVDAVILIFVDTTRVQSALQRALAAGVKVVTLGSLKNTPDTVPDVSFDWVRAGESVAQYAVWKSGGDLGMLQMRNADLYIVVNGQYKGSQDYLDTPGNCPGCDVVTQDWSLATFEDPTIGPAAQAWPPDWRTPSSTGSPASTPASSASATASTAQGSPTLFPAPASIATRRTWTSFAPAACRRCASPTRENGWPTRQSTTSTA